MKIELVKSKTGKVIKKNARTYIAVGAVITIASVVALKLRT